jgi:glycine cleavage system aminomethyltransferase T
MGDDDAIKTAFHDVTEAQGGTHVADGGWLWLEGFGDVGKEYAAIRDDVAVWDVSPLNKWDLRGSDALRAAQRLFSNDALGLEIGQARYGAFLDADGLMVDDGTVFNTGAGHCWVMTNGKDHDDYFGEALQDRLDRTAFARGRTEAHRGRRRRPPLLPVPPRARQGGRGRGLPLAHRLRR